MSQVVLILEPEAIVGLMLETELRHAGYTVIGPVATADDALAAGRDRWIDCALLSAQETGMETAALVEKLSVPAWIICDDVEQAEHARKLALGCIIKPYEMETVVQALHIAREISTSQLAHPVRIPSGLELFWHPERSSRTNSDDSIRIPSRLLRGVLGGEYS